MCCCYLPASVALVPAKYSAPNGRDLAAPVTACGAAVLGMAVGAATGQARSEQSAMCVSGRISVAVGPGIGWCLSGLLMGSESPALNGPHEEKSPLFITCRQGVRVYISHVSSLTGPVRET